MLIGWLTVPSELTTFRLASVAVITSLPARLAVNVNTAWPAESVVTVAGVIGLPSSELKVIC